MTSPRLPAPLDQGTPQAAGRPWAAHPGRAGSLAWHLGALVILAVILYPVVWVIGASFKPSKDIINSLTLLPADPILSNFKGLADGIAADIPIWTFFQTPSTTRSVPSPAC